MYRFTVFTFTILETNIKRMIETYTHSSAPRTTYAHRLKGKTSTSNEVLIITSYDYYLDKKSLSLLVNTYKEIILIPRKVDDDFLINQTIRPVIDKFSQIHLVTNPQYDIRHQVIYELVVRSNKSIRISTVYDFCEKSLKKVYIPDNIEETNPYLSPELYFNNKAKVTKMVIDTLITLILFFGSLPLWLISAFRIRYESPGPIFYRQDRIGLNQTVFPCIKFRSMGIDAELQGAVFSQRKDSRVFKYGSLMRLTRIDELPQLFSVLRGELSLIGPRPERPVFTETFEEIIPYYHFRHKVKPGITGYAQVMYPYGSGVYDARHKLMYDLYYIKNWTLLLEMKIIFQTVLVVISRKGR